MQENTVGKTIQNLRESLGISQEQMANDLLVTRQAVSQWETGATYPSIDTLKLMCEKYDVSIEAILCMGEYKKEREYELLCEKTNAFTALYESRYNTDRTAFVAAGFDNINRNLFFGFSGHTDELLNILAAVYYRVYRDTKLFCPRCHKVHSVYKTQKELDDEIKIYLGKVSPMDLDIPEYRECEEGIVNQMREDSQMIGTYFNACSLSCVYGLSYNEKPNEPERHLYSLTRAGMTGDPKFFASIIGYMIGIVTQMINKKNLAAGKPEAPGENYFLNCVAVRANDLVPGRHGEFLVHNINADSALNVLFGTAPD